MSWHLLVTVPAFIYQCGSFASAKIPDNILRFIQPLIYPHAFPLPAATKLDADSLEAIAGDAPSATLPRDQLVGVGLADVMVAVGMQPSKAAVRRMIKVGGGEGGGVWVWVCVRLGV